MRILARTILALAVLSLLVIVIAAVLFFSPTTQDSPTIVEIPRGTTASETANIMTRNGQVLSSLLLEVPMRLQNTRIEAGTYRFSEAESPNRILTRLANGDFGVEQNSIVIPEGFTREQIANRLSTNLKDFNRTTFLEISSGHEGYLFPDTYELPADTSAQEAFTVMRENFETKTTDLADEIAVFDQSRDNIVTMASLIEREAADYQIRRRIAGILWQRLENGMPLQADAVFDYFLGKNTYELTVEDLATESPYNLYTNTGLPPTPIANPGKDAIRATLNPIASDYIYYLTGDDGNFYFAETLEEHQANRQMYMN